MARDTDYAAITVNTAITEKFGREADLSQLSVTANDRTLSLRHGTRHVESTRDNLLAAVRAAANYEEFWQRFPASDRSG